MSGTKDIRRLVGLTLLMCLHMLTGCTGVNTFSTAARPGDTVMLAMGWRQELMRSDISQVTIADAAGNTVIYPSDSAAIRAVFHSYPDPLSRLLVEAETGSPSAMSTLIEGVVTAGDKEYSQAMLMLDTPQGMALGPATISVTLMDGEILPPVSLEVLSGVGESALFENREGLAISQFHLRRLERESHHTVTFAGATVPYGIEVSFVHDPDAATGGVGEAYIVSPRGDIKNVSWSDNGTGLKVILLPARDRVPTEFVHYKFYVAGGLTGLQLGAVRAFDSNGNVVPGVVAQMQ